MPKPVLGLYDNENKLRDALADNLGLIEPGLTLVDKNYPVRNQKGAAGNFDILARDKYGGFVVIEVKRSDETARQALHELSKYIALLMEDQRTDAQKIRCFVLSTHWHELDVPLAYFKSVVPVEVKGFEIDAPNKVLRVAERKLPPIDVLPKLCPDARFLYFADDAALAAAGEKLSGITRPYPQIQAALLVVADAGPPAAHAPKAVLCIWRIRDADLDVLDTIFGENGPDLERSYYEGWAAESAILDWLVDQSGHRDPEFRERTLATPEKISVMLANRRVTDMVKLGGWSPHDLVNDIQEVSRCLVAQDISSIGRRANRYVFRAFSSPRTGKSWDYIAAAFGSYIGFVASWRAEAEGYLAGVKGNVDVNFSADDCKHFYFRIYQHLHNKKADLSSFEIVVRNANGDVCGGLLGGWAWDGTTCPPSAETAVRNTYDTLDWARIALFSGVDSERYESAYLAHGFLPYLIRIDNGGKGLHGTLLVPDAYPRDFDHERGLASFVQANPHYCAQVAAIFAGIPPEPGQGGVVLIEAGGDQAIVGNGS